MARVITFSRTYPAYHPRKGQQTFFVEKITRSLHLSGIRPYDIPDGVFSTEMYYLVDPKHHTIRVGNRWKVGDYFSPRVWSGKPYASPMITIAPDIKIEKVWNIAISKDFKDTAPRFEILYKYFSIEEEIRLATNDGLSHDDLRSWFNKVGLSLCQIICWNKEIEY